MDMRVEEDYVVGHPQPNSIEGKRVLVFISTLPVCVCAHVYMPHERGGQDSSKEPVLEPTLQAVRLGGSAFTSRRPPAHMWV